MPFGMMTEEDDIPGGESGMPPAEDEIVVPFPEGSGAYGPRRCALGRWPTTS